MAIMKCYAKENTKNQNGGGDSNLGGNDNPPGELEGQVKVDDIKKNREDANNGASSQFLL